MYDLSSKQRCESYGLKHATLVIAKWEILVALTRYLYTTVYIADAQHNIYVEYQKEYDKMEEF